MWHGTFIRAVGFFPLKNCTLRYAELLVCSGSVESVKLPYLRGLPTVTICAEAASFRSISSITACVTNELGDPLSKSATDLYFFVAFRPPLMLTDVVKLEWFTEALSSVSSGPY